MMRASRSLMFFFVYKIDLAIVQKVHVFFISILLWLCGGLLWSLTMAAIRGNERGYNVKEIFHDNSLCNEENLAAERNRDEKHSQSEQRESDLFFLFFFVCLLRTCKPVKT